VNVFLFFGLGPVERRGIQYLVSRGWGGEREKGTDTHDPGMHIISRGSDVSFDLEYVLCGYGSVFVRGFVAFESYHQVSLVCV